MAKKVRFTFNATSVLDIHDIQRLLRVQMEAAILASNPTQNPANLLIAASVARLTLESRLITSRLTITPQLSTKIQVAIDFLNHMAKVANSQHWEVSGVPQEVISQFSRNLAEILESLQKSPAEEAVDEQPPEVEKKEDNPLPLTTAYQVYSASLRQAEWQLLCLYICGFGCFVIAFVLLSCVHPLVALGAYTKTQANTAIILLSNGLLIGATCWSRAIQRFCFIREQAYRILFYLEDKRVGNDVLYEDQSSRLGEFALRNYPIRPHNYERYIVSFYVMIYVVYAVILLTGS